jgi:hypothetical protein
VSLRRRHAEDDPRLRGAIDPATPDPLGMADECASGSRSGQLRSKELEVELATTRTRETLVGSVLLLGAGVAVTALIGEHVTSPLAVAVIAAVVAGERLRHRWSAVPTHVPASIEGSPDGPGFRERAAGALIIAAVFVACLVVSVVIPGGGATLLGFPLGFVVRDVVMMVRVRRWQARHRRTLVWLEDGDKLELRILDGRDSSSPA